MRNINHIETFGLMAEEVRQSSPKKTAPLPEPFFFNAYSTYYMYMPPLIPITCPVM